MTAQSNGADVLIVGQGAAAYAAAMYAARYQIRPVVFGASFGGETATGGLIENYPGYPEIDGFDLMMKFREQAVRYEVPIVDEDIVSAVRARDCFELTTGDGRVYQAPTVILAVGRERRKLGLEHEDEWVGRGVSYCSTCDAPPAPRQYRRGRGRRRRGGQGSGAAEQIRREGLRHLSPQRVHSPGGRQSKPDGGGVERRARARRQRRRVARRQRTLRDSRGQAGQRLRRARRRRTVHRDRGRSEGGVWPGSSAWP